MTRSKGKECPDCGAVICCSADGLCPYCGAELEKKTEDDKVGSPS